MIGVLVIAAVLFTLELSWGLPNGNSSWAADAIGPVTSLGIVYRSFSEWNSGWYYFKYPLGWPFLLFVAQSPVLVWQFATGRWSSPSTEYPYGFDDPEAALFAMAILGRCLNVVFALGVVAVCYAIARRLLDVWSARLAAFLVATAYPISYYAHTTNLDISYLFWLLLALYAAIVAAGSEDRRVWLLLGASAAMAVSSKEQGFAFLLPLPFMALFAPIRRHGLRQLWSAPTLAMAAGAIGTAILANNALFNPLGFVARIAFLLGSPLEPVSVRLAPVEFALWKGAKEGVYAAQVWDGIESTLGWPLVVLGLIGVLVALRRHRRAFVWMAVPIASHYYVSLRGLDLITLRYLLPVSMLVAVFAALAMVELVAWARAGGDTARLRAAQAVVACVCLLAAARAMEMVWVLGDDPRYRAEDWIAANAPAGGTAEYYQKLTYLPRLEGRIDGGRIDIEQRTIPAFAERRPSLVLLSSASRKSIFSTWNPDWRETGDLLKPSPEAVQFLEALEGERLGYRRVAVFSTEPRLLRLRITSLAPEISIYASQ